MTHLVKDGRKLSLQCKLLLAEDHELRVLRSGGGYYIGTQDEDGLPVSRDSVEYFPTFEDAEEALANDAFTPRLRP